MDIKEILLSGGSISFSYKEKPKEWVGTAKIYSFSGGWGLKPHISVEVGTVDLAPRGKKDYDYNQIDEAVSTFKSLVFRKKNLCHKMHESMIELYNSGETDLDLDDEKDLKKVRKLQKEKQNDKN